MSVSSWSASDFNLSNMFIDIKWLIFLGDVCVEVLNGPPRLLPVLLLLLLLASSGDFSFKRRCTNGADATLLKALWNGEAGWLNLVHLQ